jgi:hypothetical protein
MVWRLLPYGREETPMPNKELDDEVDPVAEDEEVVDAADEDDEFEDEEEDEEDEELEEEGDIETRGSLTHEVGSEGGSPGEDVEVSRRTSGNTRGSEASETMPGGTRAQAIERRDDRDTLIKRAP